MRSVAVAEYSNDKVLKASLLVALSGTLYGFLGYLGTKILQDNIAISTMLFWRFLVAGLWMLLFVAKDHFKNRYPINKRVLISMFLLGAVGYATSSQFYFMASESIGTGLAMVIFFSYPVMVAIAAWMMHGKKLHIGTIFILVIMIAGLFLLQKSGTHGLSFIGILFAIFSAVCYAFYVIGSKRYSSDAMNSSMLTMMVCFGCALIYAAMAVPTHQFIVPTSLNSWICILSLGILSTALPIQLMLEGLKHVSSTRASIISVLEPVVTVIVGMILLHETASTYQMLGIVMVLGSALLIQFQKEL
ncbi:MAG: DMT family transporter [Gammaproteobacteria bacterium]|nr:DMT family transporter [Gammaproteobacteria bacterium]